MVGLRRSVRVLPPFLAADRLLLYHRLNTKLEARDLQVKDLVPDLSDGVSADDDASCRQFHDL
jgi:hypothetical protein